MPGFATTGPVAIRSISNDTKIKDRPIIIRPICLVFEPLDLKNIHTPTSNKSGVRKDMRTIKICVTIAEPKSAPNNIAIPVAAAKLFFAKKFETRTATAVELWRNIAAPIPENAANNLLFVDCFNQLLRRFENPRSTPVRTNLTAQINKAAAPAILSKNCIKFGSFIVIDHLNIFS